MLLAQQITRHLGANPPNGLDGQIEGYLNQPTATLNGLEGMLNQAGVQNAAQVAPCS